MNQKKHILKPGKHQFAPGSPATHDNDNLTDEEAEWYLEKYPHIKSLFLPRLPERQVHLQAKETTTMSTNLTESQLTESGTAIITPPSGGKGGL